MTAIIFVFVCRKNIYIFPNIINYTFIKYYLYEYHGMVMSYLFAEQP